MSNSSIIHSDTPDVELKTSHHFIRGIIESDLAANKFLNRRWANCPGDAAHHAEGEPDPAKIRTRFPPEPNGYLHIGHAKSICLNFGLARDYGGVCHLRFDDTNPEKEEQEYVDSIIDLVQWLGFKWQGHSPETAQDHLFFASDYFDFMYRAAQYLIEQDLAYVDEQTADEMRANRGTLNEAGKNSPYRNRLVAESLARFDEMRQGKHPEGSMVLRAKIDMASPNMNLRDPAIYRIRHAHHHRTGDKWCVYPMYTFAHPIEDALEQITHSICTLEFEDQRPFYDWLLEHLAAGGLLAQPLPKQYEFARLNLTYCLTSKRKLLEMVQTGIVDGWDDPRLPTLAGIRRRGYTPESIQLFCERIGVSKSDSVIDYSVLEGALRDTLDPLAPRAVAVLNPLKLIIDNYPENRAETCTAPIHPHHPELGLREFMLSRELWIEAEDFTETPPKGYFRLFPGNKVRLRYGYVIECTGCEKDADGQIIAVHCNYLPDTKSGTEGSNSVKVKGNIHWVSAAHALPAEVRLFEPLFTEPQPESGGRDFKLALNPNSKTVRQIFVEASLAGAKAGKQFQFERHGYFATDLVDSKENHLVFNRITTLKDGFAKK